MMQLADLKGRFLCEMDHVPGGELPLWVAFYEEREKERKREERRARAKRGRKG